MNLIDPLHHHAATRPQDVAIVTPQLKLSWAQLDNLIWSTALTLHQEGLRPADRVGITMVHPLRHLIASLATTRLGMAHIAIPTTESIETRIAAKNALDLRSVLVDTEDLWNSDLDSILIDQLRTSPPNPSWQKALCAEGEHRTWLILQSSGTTGAPKFAELSHIDAAARFARFQSLFHCNEHDIFWAASRLDFVVAKQRTFYCLMSGAAVCLPLGIAPASRALVEFLNNTGVTMACGTPSQLHWLTELGIPMPSLRVFEARSATISENLRQNFRQKICPHLHIVYGTNEGEALALATPDLQDQVPDTVGTPTQSIEIQIIDGDGSQLPAGETGEVRVRGPGVVGVYLNNPQASARSFRDGWFHPGDLGYLTDGGALVLQGRKDDMMIFDGMNIYPAEIENTLAFHPSVREVAAFGLNHERFQNVPAAAVIPIGDVSESELIEFCKSRMGMKHPRKIFFMHELPRNAMGKILKRELNHLLNRDQQKMNLRP